MNLGDIVLFCIDATTYEDVKDRYARRDRSGYGNYGGIPEPGATVAAVVVRSWVDGGVNYLNLQLLLDCDATLWVGAVPPNVASARTGIVWGTWERRTSGWDEK